MPQPPSPPFLTSLTGTHNEKLESQPGSLSCITAGSLGRGADGEGWKMEQRGQREGIQHKMVMTAIVLTLGHFTVPGIELLLLSFKPTLLFSAL